MMMKYIFLPMEQHSDLGFGILAYEYSSSAKKLIANDKTPSTLLEALPIFFLYRHSCELYLKSAIIILHKVLKVSEDKHNPIIEVKGKPKPLFNEHGLKNLFDYFSSLILSNKNLFTKRDMTDWTAFPEELVVGIDEINKFDEKSSYYRYPLTNRNGLDDEKSQFSKIELDSIIPKENEPKSISMIYLNENREPVDAYRMKNEKETISKQLKTLQDVASNLGGASTGLRVEYLDGY